MISTDLIDFGRDTIDRRLLRGGLPPFFLEEPMEERFFQEWMDAFWAKDIQELFRVEKKHSFQSFAELLFVQSGGMFEASRFAAPCEVSRSTIRNYLSVLEATHVAQVIRPFSGRRSMEIIAAPKVYAFDTGFVAYYRGWKRLREEDRGVLWEHYVLNEMQGRRQMRDILYWRDKQGHEVDFILKRRGGAADAVECKWKESGFDPKNLSAFRTKHPSGRNFSVCNDVRGHFSRKYHDLEVIFTSLEDLTKLIQTDG
jgi:uncharacterized protein